MSRAVKEWIGKTDDSAIPAHVKDRIYHRCGKRCQECGCPLDAVIKPQFDHIVALINGGPHAEFNLQTLCRPCHGVKTAADVSEKSRVYQARANHLGFKAPKHKWQSRGFPKPEPQLTASKPLKRHSTAIGE